MNQNSKALRLIDLNLFKHIYVFFFFSHFFFLDQKVEARQDDFDDIPLPMAPIEGLVCVWFLFFSEPMAAGHRG